jgi:hypothetical protein
MFNFLKSLKPQKQKPKQIEEVYCIGSIPVDSGQISIYDLSIINININLNERELVRNIINKKKIITSKDKGLNVACFADGAYPLYVVVDKNKLVKKILIELTNTCGWGSSLFYEEWKVKKIENELISKSKVPDDQQLDVIAGIRSNVDFSSSHRVTYSPWRFLDFVKNEKEFLNKRGNTKTKLFNLDLKSEHLIIDDFQDINPKDIKKIKNNKNRKKFKIKDRFVFPLKNKTYPVHLYHSENTIHNSIKELKKAADENNDQSPAMFPILSIEGIENCRLDKSTDSSLILVSDDDKFRGLGDNIEGQIKSSDNKKYIELKICQLDIGDFKSVDDLKKILDYGVPKKLILRHFKHIDNWKILLKFFDLDEIHFDNCTIDFESKQKDDWFDVMSRFAYNRKNNKEFNDLYGDLKVFVNGQKVFDDI